MAASYSPNLARVKEGISLVPGDQKPPLLLALSQSHFLLIQSPTATGPASFGQQGVEMCNEWEGNALLGQSFAWFFILSGEEVQGAGPHCETSLRFPGGSTDESKAHGLRDLSINF